jgi:hypothetical protein
VVVAVLLLFVLCGVVVSVVVGVFHPVATVCGHIWCCLFYSRLKCWAGQRSSSGDVHGQILVVPALSTAGCS